MSELDEVQTAHLATLRGDADDHQVEYLVCADRTLVAMAKCGRAWRVISRGPSNVHGSGYTTSSRAEAETRYRDLVSRHGGAQLTMF